MENEKWSVGKKIAVAVAFVLAVAGAVEVVNKAIELNHQNAVPHRQLPTV